MRKRVSVFYVFLLFILLTIRLSAAGTTPAAKPGIAKPGLNKPKPASGTVLLKPKPTSGSSKPNTSSKPNAGVAAPKPNKPKPSNSVKPKPETNKPENGTEPKESNKPPDLNDYPKGTRLSCKIKYSIVFPDGKSEGGEEIIQGDISIIIPPLTPANMQSPYIVTGLRDARKTIWKRWKTIVNQLEKMGEVFIQRTEYWTNKNRDIQKVTAYIRYYVAPTEGAHDDVDLPPTDFGIKPTEFVLDQAF